MVGSSNVVNPQASVAMIVPAFTYLAACYVFAGVVYYFFGIETKGRLIEEIHDSLVKEFPAPAQEAKA
jgi:MFS transporter, putative metabolite:H+ symporter